MTFFKFSTILSGGAAGLCGMALPLWALGVPGVENQYAQGRKMGLNVLLLYPAAWMLIYAPYFVMRRKINPAVRRRWQLSSGVMALALLLLAAWRMLRAFETMR